LVISIIELVTVLRIPLIQLIEPLTESVFAPTVKVPMGMFRFTRERLPFMVVPGDLLVLRVCKTSPAGKSNTPAPPIVRFDVVPPDQVPLPVILPVMVRVLLPILKVPFWRLRFTKVRLPPMLIDAVR
jgi:hypothetical protein